jgi:biopolymer transport protein ExbB
MAHPAHPARRWILIILGLLLAAFWLATAGPALAPARAQQEGGAPQPPAAEENKGGEAPKPAEQPPAGQPSKNMLKHLFESIGWTYFFIFLFISIGLVALVVLLSMELRMGAAIPPGFVEDFTDTVNKRQFKAAFEMARDDGSYLARVLTTGMSRLQYGIEDAREAAFNMVETVKAGKDQLVTYLATIGTIGPMLGLVGTVWGMIKTFRVLAEGGPPNAGRLAEGIAHALVVTLVGVAISVPAIFCHAFYRNRLTRIANETAGVADDLLTQMYHNSRKPVAPEPVTATTAVPDPRAAAAAIKPK